MKYVNPQINHVLKADSTIQGMQKEGITRDSFHVLSAANPGYKADE
jgi:hypothetical protein